MIWRREKNDNLCHRLISSERGGSMKLALRTLSSLPHVEPSKWLLCVMYVNTGARGDMMVKTAGKYQHCEAGQEERGELVATVIHFILSKFYSCLSFYPA